MGCKHMEALLSAYLDHDLDAGDRRAVDAHLRECSRCRELLSLLRDVSASLQSFPEIEISPSLRGRLLSIPDQKRRFRLSLDFLVRPSLQPVLAAAALFLTVVSLYAFSPQRSTINKSIVRQLHLGYHKIGKLYTQAESFTSTLMGYKDDLLVSLQDKNPLRREDE
jgi:predicted anti-sigma-YlaC factor YlaD